MTTSLYQDGTIEITDLTSDWDYGTDKPASWPDYPRISSIEFHPGAANDLCIVRNHKEAGVRRFSSNYADSQSDSRIKYFHGARIDPFIDYSECVVSSGHVLIIELWREA